MKFIKTIARKLGSNKHEFSLEEHEIIMKATRRLAKIKSINYGGCAISALALYRYMVKNGIVNDSTSFEFMYSYRVPKSGIPDSCSHVVLHHNGKYYDSNGLYEMPRHTTVYSITDPDLVLQSINTGLWNNSFNRRESCCMIAWSLGISLKDVKR